MWVLSVREMVHGGVYCNLERERSMNVGIFNEREMLHDCVYSNLERVRELWVWALPVRDRWFAVVYILI